MMNRLQPPPAVAHTKLARNHSYWYSY